MKGANELPGLGDIKSIHSGGVRSIPKVQRSSYLELYMLKREKDRLEKVIFSIDKRRSASIKQLSDITKRVKGLQKETQEEEEKTGYRGTPARPLKSMAVKY